MTGYERDMVVSQHRQAEALGRIADALERLAPLLAALTSRAPTSAEG